MKKINQKKLSAIAVLLIVCLVIPIVFSFISRARMVDVYTTDKSLELQWANIYGDKSDGYRPSNDSKILGQNNGEYIMQSNSWAMWSVNDSISYAYTPAKFNTGSDSLLTIKCTIAEWNGKEIGIAVRKSLSPGSQATLFSIRPDDAFYLLYRLEENSNYSYVKANNKITLGNQDVHMKVEVDKSKGRITTYYKLGGDIQDDNGWTSAGAKPCPWVKGCSTLYAGIAMSTASETLMGTAVCRNFSVNLKAPEGYVEENGGGSSDTPVPKPDETLPEDFETVGDALLYESFTDGNLYPKGEEVSAANPYWTVRCGEPVLKVDDAATNRYLFTSSGDDPLMMTAGDMEWTDYSVQMDFIFPESVIVTEMNRMDLLVRHRSAVIGGSGEYSVSIMNQITDGQFAGQYLRVYWRGAEKTFLPNIQKLLGEVCISNAKDGMIALGTRHVLKVDAMDNVLTVYLDDMNVPVLQITETTQRQEEGESTPYNDPYLVGQIGLIVRNADLQIDNILVRKLYDPLGGDYDNHIMGNYNEPVPDWIAERYGYSEEEKGGR